jgi:glycosyltransferase involved in cell wall biosynthesis
VRGIVLAGQGQLAATAVCAASWRDATGEPAVVLVDHPDLVAPHRRVHGPEVRVLSWADLDVEPEARGDLVLAACAAVAEPGEVCVVLPHSALVLAPPAALVEAAARSEPAAARRAAQPPEEEDRRRPTADDVRALGPVHGGLLAVRADDPRAEAIRELLDGAADDAAIVVVDDPGCGVAWWNLHERPLERRGEVLTAGGAPVSVLDLDGWDPRHAHMLHPDMTRLLGSEDPVLRGVVAEYAERRTAAAVAGAVPEPVPWPGDPVLAALVADQPADERAALLRGARGARERFAAWLAGTDPEDTVWGLNRYLVALRRVRYDLQAAFPDLADRTDSAAYLAWAREHGRAQGIPEAFLGPVAALGETGTAAGDGPAAAGDDGPEGEGPTAPEAPGRLDGVNLVGLFDEPALGVAEIARQVEAGLRHGGVPVRRVTVDRRGRPLPAEDDGPFPFRVTIACVNADLLPVVRHRLRHRVPSDGHHVAVWWWELEEVPDAWAPAMELVHEVWAGTRFVAEAFERRFDRTVRHVPLGLATLADVAALPSVIADDDRPYVLVAFDHASRAERKNPIGAIRAFDRAELGDGVRLVVKSVNGEHWPREHEAVRLAALDATADVVLLDERIAAGAQAALVAGAAAHLALHRAEGLGLTIVESLLRGVPVVATDYGGSTDLLDERTGWPVPWSPAVVPEGLDPYPAGARWAEPDEAAAAAALREVLAGGPDVRARASAGRAAARARAARIASGDDLVAATSAVLAEVGADDARRWAEHEAAMAADRRALLERGRAEGRRQAEARRLSRRVRAKLRR